MRTQLSVAFNDNALAMLAAEGGECPNRDNSGRKRIVEPRVSPRSTREMASCLQVPSSKRMLAEGKAMDMLIPTGLAQAFAQKDYAKLVPELVNHELIHVTDLIGIRNKWNSSDKSATLSKFEEKTTLERGQSLIKAFPQLPASVRKVYAPLVKGKMGGKANRPRGFPEWPYSLLERES